jgi:hypothetical protein
MGSDDLKKERDAAVAVSIHAPRVGATVRKQI